MVGVLALAAVSAAPAVCALEKGEFQDGLYTAPGAIFTVRSPLGLNPWVIDSFDRSAGAVTFIDETGGLFGIESGLEPPEPSSGGFSEDPDLEMVPMTLAAAVDRFEGSAVAREYLGEEFVRFYAGTRRWELKQERAHVTDWEVARYADAL